VRTSAATSSGTGPNRPARRRKLSLCLASATDLAISSWISGASIRIWLLPRAARLLGLSLSLGGYCRGQCGAKSIQIVAPRSLLNEPAQGILAKDAGESGHDVFRHAAEALFENRHNSIVHRLGGLLIHQFLDQRRFDHDLATSKNGQQMGIIILQVGHH